MRRLQPTVTEMKSMAETNSTCERKMVIEDLRSRMVAAEERIKDLQVEMQETSRKQ